MFCPWSRSWGTQERAWLPGITIGIGRCRCGVTSIRVSSITITYQHMQPQSWNEHAAAHFTVAACQCMHGPAPLRAILPNCCNAMTHDHVCIASRAYSCTLDRLQPRPAGYTAVQDSALHKFPDKWHWLSDWQCHPFKIRWQFTLSVCHDYWPSPSCLALGQCWGPRPRQVTKMSCFTSCHVCHCETHFDF